MFLQYATDKPEIAAEKLFSLFGLDITNAMLAGVLVSLIYIVLSLWIKRSIKLSAGKFQTILEMSVESFLNLLTQITSSRKTAEKLLPLIGALFLFLGLSNLITLIPFVSSFTYNGIPLFRTPTNDYNMTFSIALAMIILIQFSSIKKSGVFGYLGNFFKFKGIYEGFKKGIGAGVFAVVDFLIGLLDIVSEIAKVISLSLRLFGNMYAGEVLAAILLGAFAIAIPAPWLAMNIFVGFLQAMVFGSLTAAYYTLAVAENGDNQTN